MVHFATNLPVLELLVKFGFFELAEDRVRVRVGHEQRTLVLRDGSPKLLGRNSPQWMRNVDGGSRCGRKEQPSCHTRSCALELSGIGTHNNNKLKAAKKSRGYYEFEELWGGRRVQGALLMAWGS